MDRKRQVMEMDAQKKYQILLEGQSTGVSSVCRRYGISRTLYYRWLSRYKTLGLEGLEPGKRNTVPVNLTPPQVENQVLKLIRSHPTFGPREISYLLEEEGQKLSESGVYNIMRRHGLSTREKRIRFARKKTSAHLTLLPSLPALKSGECLFFSLTPCASHKNADRVYEYTLMDYRSRIACSRLYTERSAACFIDLLTAVALPVAHSLDFNPKYLCFAKDPEMTPRGRQDFVAGIQEILHSSGFDLKLIFLEEEHPLTPHVVELKNEYNRTCLSAVMPLFLAGESLEQIKLRLQRRIRNYNLHQKLNYEGLLMSPTEYHSHMTGSSRILPLWAYMDRLY